VLKLAVVARSVGVPDSLFVTALAALLAAAAQLVLMLAVGAIPWRPDRGPGDGTRRALAGAVFIGLALLGAGAVLHLGGGVHAPRGVLVCFAAWCLLAALAAPRLSGWLAGRRSGEESAARRARRLTLALPALLLAAAAVSLVRRDAPGPGAACAAAGAVLVVFAPSLPVRFAAVTALALWLAAGGVRWLPAPGSHDGPKDPPAGSLVLIVLDTTRADALDPYGASGDETPAFDRLTRSSALYEELISTSPWTVPSHATLFTGLHPREHDCWFGGRRWLDDELETVAEVLAARGYETAAFYGNQHLSSTNLLQGFGLQLFLESPASPLMLGQAMRYSGVGVTDWIDRGGSRAVAKIDAWLASRRDAQPFFLFVNLFEAHEDYVSPIREHRWPAGVGALDALRAIRRYDAVKWSALRRSEGRDEDIVRAAYANAIRHQDRILGKLLDKIAARYAIDRLPIVVTADHGDSLGEGGRWGHNFGLNDALIHLPLVIHMPGRAEPGSQVPGQFSSVDLPATLLDLAGVDGRFGAGRSLLGDREPEATTVAESFPFFTLLHKVNRDFVTDLGRFRWPMSSVRADGHKLVIWHGGPTQLYELASDPAEAHEVLPQQSELGGELLERYDSWTREVPRERRGTDAPPKALDPELTERLRALGYL
jgi:arylsulfatase A-like enzyme